MIYLDYNATTPALDSIRSYFPEWLEVFGNPSSLHRAGRAALDALEESRASVLRSLALEEDYALTFTSGGTESNHLALQAFVEGPRPGRNRVLLGSIEHPSVLYQRRRLERVGYEVELIPVLASGVVDLDWLKKSIDESVAVVAMMYANNETGAVQPTSEVSRLCQLHGVHFHCDAAQVPGKLRVDWRDLTADSIGLSGHKVYAPKGIGALLHRTRPAAVFVGGPQEKGARAGTENVPGALAFAHGLAATLEESAAVARMSTLRDRMEASILGRLPAASIVAGRADRLANTTCVVIPGFESDRLVIALDNAGFCVSRGAACHSGVWEPSHVLLAMGLTREQAECAIRISLGHPTEAEDTQVFVDTLVTVVETQMRRETTRSH
ncbi:MAG: cysteine desulfurase [Leptospiraceae bacterium]|nr:cysteine desulfurase [Leptospiraceae bacterium]